jgi:hypothetical protein
MINFERDFFVTSAWKKRFFCLPPSGCEAGSHFRSHPSSGSTMGPSRHCSCRLLQAAVIATIRAVLKVHNTIEEGPGGLYETCDELAGSESTELLAKLQAAPELAVLPCSDSPVVMPAVQRALERAGYGFCEGTI